MASATDTNIDSRNAQLTALRRLGTVQRLLIGLQMSDETRAITAAGVRARHPNYTPEETRRALIRLILGDPLYREVWPGERLLDP